MITNTDVTGPDFYLPHKLFEITTNLILFRNKLVHIHLSNYRFKEIPLILDFKTEFQILWKNSEM